MAALGAFVTARLEILKCNERIGASADKLKKLSADAAVAISSKLSSCRLTDIEVANLIATMSQSQLQEPDRLHVIDALNAKIGSEMSGPSPRTSLQDGESLHGYFTTSEWTQLSKVGNLAAKVDMVISRGLNLGLRNPSERTFATMAAIACVGSSIDPQVALALVKEIKKRFRSKGKCIVADTTTQWTQLPQLPACWKAKHEMQWAVIYKDGDPVTGPLVDWSTMIKMIPCRMSRAGCSDVVSVSRAGSSAMLAVADAAKWQQCSRSPLDLQLALPSTAQQPQQQTEWRVHHDSPQSEQSPKCQSWVSQTQSADSQQEPVSSSSPQASSPNASVLGVLALPAPAEPESAADDELEQMVATMKAQLNPDKPVRKQPVVKQQVMKRPAAALPQPVMKRPAAALPEPVVEQPAATLPEPVVKQPVLEPGKPLVLGCCKCRFKAHGCAQCKDPRFGGRRGHP